MVVCPKCGHQEKIIAEKPRVLSMSDVEFEEYRRLRMLSNCQNPHYELWKLTHPGHKDSEEIDEAVRNLNGGTL